MKKRIVTYLLLSALAAAVFAGCGKKDAGDGADAAATGEAAVVEATAEVAETAAAADTAAIEDVAAAAEAADAEEAAAIAGTTDAAAAEEAAVPEEGVTEVVDDEETVEADKEETPAEGEYLVVDPGTQYTVRFGGNIYSSPEEIAENIMYVANPGDYLNVVERLDNFWYKVTYYLAGEGIEHTGYIQIQ